MFSSDIRSGMTSPTNFSRMNVPIADHAITNKPANNCYFSSVNPPP